VGDRSVPETKEFSSIVWRAKRNYWKHIIDRISDDKSLYKVISWHKLSPRLKSPPLKVNGVIVEDSMDKAKALKSEILERFSAEDDLSDNPLQNWEGRGNLKWDQTVSLEEVERNTIGVSSTSPGADCVTVRLLKSCWEWVKHAIHGLFAHCLALTTSPSSGNSQR
jgi:hypothetical protein